MATLLYLQTKTLSVMIVYQNLKKPKASFVEAAESLEKTPIHYVKNANTIENILTLKLLQIIMNLERFLDSISSVSIKI